MKIFSWIVLFVVVSSITPMSAYSQPVEESIVEEEIDTVDLGSITCRDFLKLSGEEEDNIITFLHGYISGTQNNAVIDIDVLGEATDKIKDMCIDHPKKLLLDVFKANR